MKLYSILPTLALCLGFASQAAHAVTCQPGRLASNPDTAYTFPTADTVTHAPTGLTWKRCSEGQDWNGSTCTGSPGTYTWAQALALGKASVTAGKNDWRVPNVKELRSLVEECRERPAINEAIFPGTPVPPNQTVFWSSSPQLRYDGALYWAWTVDFASGLDSSFERGSQNNYLSVRLVRGGDSFDKIQPSATSLLSVSANGSGSISAGDGSINCSANAGSLSGTCLAPLATNSSVTLTATAASGGTFNGWSGFCKSTTVNTCTVPMNTARAVTANFSGGTSGTPAPPPPPQPQPPATTAPAAPTGLAAVSGNGSASIIFNLSATATSYTASCTGGASTPGTASGSPITVTGMTNDTAYMCSVVASNSLGKSPASDSVAVTPAVPVAPPPSTGTCYPLSNITESQTASAHNGSVTMTAGGVDSHGVPCPGWGITNNNQDWISGVQITGAPNSTTSYIISYAVAKNPSTSPRTGTLVFGDPTYDPANARTYTIAQAGTDGALPPPPPPPPDVTNPPAVVGTLVTRYRLYSEITKEHLYTTDTNEYSVLGGRGWAQEGAVYQLFQGAGTLSAVTSVPYYRLYNTNTRQHYWTPDLSEYNRLGLQGLNKEGIDGYILPTAVTGTLPLYHLSLDALGGLDLWTTDANEKTVLTTSRGWVFKGVDGYVSPAP